MSSSLRDTVGTSIRDFSREKSGIQYSSDEGGVQVNPSDVVDKVKDVDVPEGVPLPRMELPGHGPLGEDCGEDIPQFCAGCGKVHTVGSTCYNWRCPRGWKGADRKRATTICSKLEALRRYKEAPTDGWDGWKFHHLVLSPPDGFTMSLENPEAVLERTMELVKELLDELGAATGVMFYHPFRGPDGDDRGFWKDVLPDGVEVEWEVTEDGLRFEPHFHAIVLSKFVAGGFITKALTAKTGWVVKRITKGGDDSDSDVSIYGEYDLARAVTYCLSHSAVRTSGENDRLMYRYFGEVHNFTPTEKIEAQMDAAVRSVAPKTLGLEYSSVACSEERTQLVDPEEEAERVNRAAMYEGSGAGDDGPVEEVETETVECGGRLLDIKKAPAFLEDSDWLARAAHADELQDAWEKWRDRVDNPVEDAYTGATSTPEEQDGPPPD
jgi:hypothetical protein